jgi:regulator of protease activity HflC (stomatin/prohibitin superfamily)
VSAELRKSTASVRAQVYRNQTVPAAEAEALGTENLARADGKTLRGKAAGEAWAFRALESEYRAAPADYFFRRRLEALENGLGGQSFTVVDVRIQRDGGELWLTP